MKTARTKNVTDLTQRQTLVTWVIQCFILGKKIKSGRWFIQLAKGTIFFPSATHVITKLAILGISIQFYFTWNKDNENMFPLSNFLIT